MRTLINLALMLAALAASIGCGSAAWAEGLPIPRDFTTEAREALDKQVPILVLFMSRDCTFCETALQDFLLPMHRDPAFANKVMLRQIEIHDDGKLVDFDGKTTTYSRFSSNHNASLVPHVVLFNSHGHELETIEGLLTLDFYYGILVNAIEDSTAKIKADTF